MTIFDKNADTQDKVQYHLRVRPGDVADYVLLPGDPARVELIAEHLDDSREIAYHREYRTVTGSYHGIPVSATSTGIGCPSAAIAVEELYNVGVSHFIRVGSSAAFVPGIAKGDILINTGSMRCDGASAMYVDEGFPAVADHFLVRALIDAAADLGPTRRFGMHVGINVSSDAFYAETPEWVDRMIKQKIMNVEMESSAIFTIAHLRSAKAAMVCACSYNFTASEEIDYEGVNEPLIVGWHNAIDVALEGIRRHEETKRAE